MGHAEAAPGRLGLSGGADTSCRIVIVRYSIAPAIALMACGRIGFDPAPTMGDAVGDGTVPGDTLVLPGVPFPVGFSAPGMERNPSVAWDGAQFVVGWNDNHGRTADGSIAGSLVSRAAVVQPPTVWLGGGFIQAQGPAIACNVAGGCAIVTGDFTGSSALGRALVTNGVPGAAGTLVNRASNFPAVASIGTRFLVVYNDILTPSVNSVMIDAGGAIVSTPVQLVAPLGQTQAVSATANGYVAAWQRDATIEYTTLDPAGVILSAKVSVAGSDIARPAIASAPTVSLLVWNELGSHVRGLRIAADGTALDPVPLSITQATTTARPTVTWDGISFLVAFERRLDVTTASLAAVAVDPDTGMVGPETELTPAASPVTDFVPALASDRAGTSLCVFQRNGPTMASYGLLIKR